MGLELRASFVALLCASARTEIRQVNCMIFRHQQQQTPNRGDFIHPKIAIHPQQLIQIPRFTPEFFAAMWFTPSFWWEMTSWLQFVELFVFCVFVFTKCLHQCNLQTMKMSLGVSVARCQNICTTNSREKHFNPVSHP